MTYIFGARCRDGVVLVGDRKVTYKENTEIDFRQKLYRYHYPTVVGAAGSTFLFDIFREDGSILAKKYDGKINIYSYMKDIREKVREYYRLYGSTLVPWNFDILFAAQTPNGGAILKYIYGGDAVIDDARRYKVIGSNSGRTHNSTLLEPLWNSNINMEKTAEFGYFMIKYIEKYNLDNSIGTGKEKPQIWFVPDKGKLREINEDSSLEILENKVQSLLIKNERNLKDLFEL